MNEPKYFKEFIEFLFRTLFRFNRYVLAKQETKEKKLCFFVKSSFKSYMRFILWQIVVVSVAFVKLEIEKSYLFVSILSRVFMTFCHKF
jgi:hypothetical protein